MATRAKLIEEATSKGIDVPPKATRNDIARLLQEHDAANNGHSVEQVPVDGFIVAKITNEQGAISVDVHPIGNATVLEAVSVLSLALAAAKKNVGME